MPQLFSENFTKYEEQIKLAEYLDSKSYCWCYVPKKLKKKIPPDTKGEEQNLDPSIPSILIFDSPNENYSGVVIKLKREEKSKLKDNQAARLTALLVRGWRIKVALKADTLINWLEELFKKTEFWK